MLTESDLGYTSADTLASQAMCRTRFNRELNELHKLAVQLRDKAEAFADSHDEGSLTAELESLGIDCAAMPKRTRLHTIEAVFSTTRDAYGLAWAAEKFVNAVECDLRDVDQPGEDETTPCAVVGGTKGGA